MLIGDLGCSESHLQIKRIIIIVIIIIVLFLKSQTAGCSPCFLLDSWALGRSSQHQDVVMKVPNVCIWLVNSRR